MQAFSASEEETGDFMPFARVPCQTRSQINKAGKMLAEQNGSIDPQSFFEAITLVNTWRACHAYPINTFQATLRGKLSSELYGRNPIAAQRLKRMPTIIDKLKRYPEMQLTRMQDIGGLRAILDTVKDVYRLAEEYRGYRNNKGFLHELVQDKDYIKNPRDDDGYRSLHLIYKYKNKRVPDYNGLRLELQIRTKKQHAWATAVETMGTFLGQALKSRRGDREWLDFFAITSSAFAHLEKTPPVPRFSTLTSKETFSAVAEAEAKLGAFEKMDALSTAAFKIVEHRHDEKWSYHLIELNSLEKKVKITAYARDSLEQALKDYSTVEAQAVEGKKIEPVLVSAGSLENLRQAYPNFFLDITEFIKITRKVVETGKQRVSWVKKFLQPRLF